VRVKAFVTSFPLNLAYRQRPGLHWDEEAIEYARQSFDMKQLPNAVRLMVREENKKPDKVYHVISFVTKCEGEIWKGGGRGEDYEPTTFTQRRQHKVAIVASELGEERMVLLTDVEYLHSEGE
jgi:hypothetical protein